MAWHQIEATPAHLAYLIIFGFLTLFTLFSVFIRSRLHIAEPPLALVTGVLFGPRVVNAWNPLTWKLQEHVMQESTRVIAGLQVFVVGIELPKRYIKNHWPSLLWMIGPVMATGWIIGAALIYLLFNTTFTVALIISACLTPTDPVLAASILSNSLFSTRVPGRLKRLLSSESGCNDGAAFPFLYVGLSILTKNSTAGAVKKWFLITILWQCLMGIVVGIAFGLLANHALRFSDKHRLIGPYSFLVFYFVLAFLSVGIGSTLGLDDFLVSFSAGAAFSHDGWFARRTKQSHLNVILDLLINSAFFIYFGAVIPWDQFVPGEFTPTVTPGRLVALLALVLALRRIPALLVLKPLIPDIHTWYEALFAGHFGPMGVGALFLAIEARAQLETGDSSPLDSPDPTSPNIGPIKLVWPIISFVVVGSTLVHGLSVVVLSVISHFRRPKDKRASFMGAESDPLDGMVHDDTTEDSEQEEEEREEREEEWRERSTRIILPG